MLTAVFVPCAFISGIVGQFFKQFALTIATSTVISAFNSLTLSPALAAMLIKPKSREKPEALPRLAYALAGAATGVLLPGRPNLGGPDRTGLDGPPWWTPAVAIGGRWSGRALGWVVGWPADRFLVWFFGVFNAGFTALTRPAIPGSSGSCSKGSFAVLLVYGGLLYLTYYAFDKTPTGFIPSQDKGYLLVNVQMPDSTSVEKTQAGHEAGRGDRPEDAGRQAHRGDRRVSRSCSTPTPPTSGRCT